MCFSAKTVGFLGVEERDLEPLETNVVLSIEDNVVRALDTVLVYQIKGTRSHNHTHPHLHIICIHANGIRAIISQVKKLC